MLETPARFLALDFVPRDIIMRLNTDVNRALAAAALTERIMAVGNLPAAMSPSEFGEKSREDSDRFGAIVHERGITAGNQGMVRKCVKRLSLATNAERVCAEIVLDQDEKP